ncbi:MAG: matrixin family metalloprotease, partial [Verrucomicrobiota bacterium]
MLPFTGYIDDVQIYAVAFTSNQVHDLFKRVQFEPAGTIGTYEIPFRTGSIIPTPGVGDELNATPGDEVVHAIILMDAKLETSALQMLQTADLEVVYTMTPRSLTVKGTADSVRNLNGLRWSNIITPNRKVARSVAPNNIQAGRILAIQFHPSVSEAEATAIASTHGATLRQPGYVPHSTYLIVDANDAQLDAIVAEDEVAWVIPGPGHLIAQGLPVRTYGCRLDPAHGPHSAPFVTISEGWDGPGLGSADITYNFVNASATIANANQIMVDALNKWAAVAALTFTETQTEGLNDSFDIYHTPDASQPFDGPGGVLAYAFIPNDVAPEPLAGNAHYDPSEGWVDFPSVAGNEIDLRSVALHEFGHSLGLGHSEVNTAIMAPFYQPGLDPVELTQDDIDGIQSIYGIPVTPPDPPGPGPTNPTPTQVVFVAQFFFDDEGTTAENFARPNNWIQNWDAAGTVVPGAAFSTNLPWLDNDFDLSTHPNAPVRNAASRRRISTRWPNICTRVTKKSHSDVCSSICASTEVRPKYSSNPFHDTKLGR